MLVEAKAHAGELHLDGKTPGNSENDKRISAAVAAANDALGGAAAGWSLCTDTHYQLCNRFAWAWKVASLGVPVVLVYLGFLDADEMGDGAFRTPEAWRSCLLAHADGVVPPAAWEQRLPAGNSWFVPIIRAARISAVAVDAITHEERHQRTRPRAAHLCCAHRRACDPRPADEKLSARRRCDRRRLDWWRPERLRPGIHGRSGAAPGLHR